ncbi:hypothetical protein AAU57_11920 [Nonlabens sp. YIK11]|uniref:hypothetical protein n=1 Tax=Nonlabens sp. YIK11 TaxID=1453349 RepID=UPI0006DBE58C|nr:hypothetical protein [Nonlabens sp. YIK11]KQC33955.1 hypothetical protein AAU57_11920 [Nonlabens sp. YIK11]
MSVIILSHELNEVELQGFFYEPNYGWCFSYYENEEEALTDSGSYGLFPADFVETETNHQDRIELFLSKSPKIPLKDIDLKTMQLS